MPFRVLFRSSEEQLWIGGNLLHSVMYAETSEFQVGEI